MEYKIVVIRANRFFNPIQHKWQKEFSKECLIDRDKEHNYIGVEGINIFCVPETIKNITFKEPINYYELKEKIEQELKNAKNIKNK